MAFLERDPAPGVLFPQPSGRFAGEIQTSQVLDALVAVEIRRHESERPTTECVEFSTITAYGKEHIFGQRIGVVRLARR